MEIKKYRIKLYETAIKEIQNNNIEQGTEMIEDAKILEIVERNVEVQLWNTAKIQNKYISMLIDEIISDNGREIAKNYIKDMKKKFREI